ncbi:MAG: Cationic amino acid transporter 2 [Piccolia ochrophora]|nr:MAG: Cationic amino acid transporter 2 [Piccolia ochrophora]
MAFQASDSKFNGGGLLLETRAIGDEDRGSVAQSADRRRMSVTERVTRRLFHKDHLDRKLQRPHITGIAFSGTIGIGLFVTAGNLVGLSGSLGCVISYIVAGLIITAVMRSLAEMVSVRPLSGALIDYPHTFVDPALGFAVGVTYCLAQCISMATLTASAARSADKFTDYHSLKDDQKSGIIIGLCIITLLSNICGVKLYGTLERIVKWLKILLFLALCILMILVQAGVRGEEGVTRRIESGYGSTSITPFLKWDGFNGTKIPVDEQYKSGIPGKWGQFLSIWTSIIIAMFACMGGDIVIVSAGEAESPRKDLPPAARFMYLVPVGFYILTSFLMGFNINYMNRDLLHPWASSNESVSHSPFIIILKMAAIKTIPGILNACFLFSAYTAANTGLFVCSRTLFALAQTYGNVFVKKTLGRTNDGHTPVAAILVCSTFGLLAFLGLADKTFDQPILTLASFFTGAVACVYASECIAFLRFKSGLTQLEKNEVFSRDDPTYKKKHYRAHWQPLWAIFGLFACTMIIIFSGWPAIYLLCEKGNLDPRIRLKHDKLLAADIIGAYSGPLVFITCYLGYKIIYRTRFQRFRDFENEYFLPEFDREPLEPYHAGPKWKRILSETWSFIK